MDDLTDEQILEFYENSIESEITEEDIDRYMKGIKDRAALDALMRSYKAILGVLRDDSMFVSLHEQRSGHDARMGDLRETVTEIRRVFNLIGINYEKVE